MVYDQSKLKDILDQKGITYEVVCHEPVRSMDDVLRVLKVPLAQTAKTLVVKYKNELILAVVPGDKRLSKKLLAAVLHVGRGQLDLLAQEEVELKTGMPIGGVPPFGIADRVVIDENVMRQEQIYCGFGSLTSSLKISPKDIQRLSPATVGSIAY